jgi:plasmid stabilization system protein ParE
MRLEGVRSWRVSGFPNWQIFYVATESELRVLHVLHGSQDLDMMFGEEGA